MGKYLSSVDWLIMVLYAAFGFILATAGVGVVESPLHFFALLCILIVVDLRSHKKGLDKGVEIAYDVLKEFKK